MRRLAGPSRLLTEPLGSHVQGSVGLASSDIKAPSSPRTEQYYAHTGHTQWAVSEQNSLSSSMASSRISTLRAPSSGTAFGSQLGGF